MAMPRTLKMMNVFINGFSYLGVVSSLTLPKLTRKLEMYRGAGMPGAAPIDFGLDDDALSMELSLGGFPDEALWSIYGAVGAGELLRYAGSYQRDDTGEIVPVEVVTRFKMKEMDTGENKQGEKAESKLPVICTYFKLTINGKELVEIDVINAIEKVNGVDRLEQHRKNIGLI
jgi:P2 family phage contractile tail tube protein